MINFIIVKIQRKTNSAQLEIVDIINQIPLFSIFFPIKSKTKVHIFIAIWGIFIKIKIQIFFAELHL